MRVLRTLVQWVLSFVRPDAVDLEDEDVSILQAGEEPRRLIVPGYRVGDPEMPSVALYLVLATQSATENESCECWVPGFTDLTAAVVAYGGDDEMPQIIRLDLPLPIQGGPVAEG